MADDFDPKKAKSHKVPPRTATKDQVLKAVVVEAVKRYSRRCWWADQEEMKQEAWLVALSASRTFKAETWGDSHVAGLYWYAWRAVVIQLRNYLWRQSAPVHAPQRKLPELAGVVRAPIEAAPHEATHEHPEQLLHTSERRALIQQAVLGRIAPDLLPLAKAALDGDAKALRMVARRVEKTALLRMLHNELD